MGIGNGASDRDVWEQKTRVDGEHISNVYFIAIQQK